MLNDTWLIDYYKVIEQPVMRTENNESKRVQLCFLCK